RSADRDHALAAHTLHRLLDPRTFRRLRRDRNGHLRTLYELERAASDLVRHAAAGHLLLGPRDLSDRGTAVPAHRLPDALAVREIEGIPAARYTVCDRAGDGDRRGSALRLGLSRDLSAALVQQILARARPAAALAVGVHPVLCRRARRGVARRRTCAAINARQ